VIYSLKKKPFYKNLSRTGNKNARSVYLDKIVQVPRRVAVSSFFSPEKKTSTAIARRKFIFASLQIRTNVAEDPYPSTV